jgi:hypothetical protein
VLRGIKKEIRMSPHDKKILGKIYDKHYDKGSKARQEKIKVEKVVKERAVDKINRRLAEKGIPIQFASGKDKETDRKTALRVAPEMKPQAQIGIPAMEASRNDLMMRAKDVGIKNYRVLNKQELIDALAARGAGNQVKLDAIVAGAVARWKSGWGKGKKQ